MTILRKVETMFPCNTYEIAQTGENKFALFRNRQLLAMRSDIRILEVMLMDYIK